MKINVLLVWSFVVLSFQNQAWAKNDSLSEGWVYGLGIDYSLTGREYTYTSGKDKSNNGAITANIQFENMPLINFQIMRSKKDSFGFYFKYSYFPKSNVTGGKVTKSGVTTNATTELYVDSFSINIFHIGSLFRFDKWIIPFGFNITDMPVYSIKASASPGSAISKGMGNGFEISALYPINSHVIVEGGYRRLSTSYGQMTFPFSNVYADYGIGNTSEFILGIKYFL